MDFIFMLTRADRTVTDCLEVAEIALAAGVSHIGFKDVGVPFETLRQLHARLRTAGVTTYLEVVNTDDVDCLRAAHHAVELGVDRLMGGTQPTAMKAVLANSSVAYLPFPGRPEGHPTRLGGTPRDVEADCRAFMATGCAGCDLLAYRATEADPIALVQAARSGLGQGYLLCAGSIRTTAQIEGLREAQCDGFTVGSAVFEGAFVPHMGSTKSQLSAILAAARGIP